MLWGKGQPEKTGLFRKRFILTVTGPTGINTPVINQQDSP